MNKSFFDAYFAEVNKAVIGQLPMVKQLMIGIMTDGNILMEGYPGLAKTLVVKTMAEIMELKFSRIQGTPDLMPSDITGTYIIEETKQGRRQFKFQPGPIFANIVLADEINRATPKTQSALLEAMQEKQVSVGTETYKLDPPFFILATQNPIEQEGSLALDQVAFVNGEFIDGYSLLEKAKSCESITSKDKCLYKLEDSYTLSMNYQGKLVRSPCWMYTLDYKGELITVETEGGRKIKVTDNHPFVVEENGFFVWKKAGLLKENDLLACPKHSAIKSCNQQENSGNAQKTILLSSTMDIISEKIALIEKKPFDGSVFGLTVPGPQNYLAGIGACGINHNTYPLPEAQADRFLLKVVVDYPSLQEEIEIVNLITENESMPKLKKMLDAKRIIELQSLTRKVPIANDIKQYAVELVTSTRKKKDLIEFGASPRASIGLVLAAKARALIEGRRHVSKEDIKEMSFPVMRHRIILSFEAQRQNMTEDDVIRSLIK